MKRPKTTTIQPTRLLGVGGAEEKKKERKESTTGDF